MSTTLTAVVAIISALVGSKIWEVITRKMELKKETDFMSIEAQGKYRDDLWKRISDLESALSDSVKDRESLLERITVLSKDIAVLSTKLEFLERENIALKEELKGLKGK